MRTPLLALLLTSLFALGACTMPGASTDTGTADGARGDTPERGAAAPDARDATPSGPAAAGSPQGAAAGDEAAARLEGPVKAPPMSEPAGPGPSPAAGAVDTRCRTDADCAVKNVGSCCGAMPACVNVGAKPDVAAVQAQCEREGMSSVCGFKEIQGCACVAGTCQDASGGAVDR